MKNSSLILVAVLALTAVFVVYRLLSDGQSSSDEIASEVGSPQTPVQAPLTNEPGSADLTSRSPGPVASESESAVSDSQATPADPDVVDSTRFGPVSPEASGVGVAGAAPDVPVSDVLGPAPEASGSGILGPAPEASGSGILGPAPEESDRGLIGLPPEVSGLGIPTEAPEATGGAIPLSGPEVVDPQSFGDPPESTPDRP